MRDGNPHPERVRARVWSTGRDKDRTWHYRVTCGNKTVLYDNTGMFQPILNAALIRVEALRHMVIAGHKLKEYKGDML